MARSTGGVVLPPALQPAASPTLHETDAARRSSSSPSTSYEGLRRNFSVGRQTRLLPTPAATARKLWGQIVEHVDKEWHTRSMNLGVKSGTGVVEELLMRKVQEWVQELNVLAISNEQASDTLGTLARGLTKQQLQQLQIMLDSMGFEFLSDFIRVAVFNTSSPFASTPIDGPDSSLLKSHRRRSKARTRPPSSVKDRASTASGMQSVQPGPRPEREEFIRFAGYLPPEHPLVQKAYRLYLSRLPPEADGGGLAQSNSRSAEELLNDMRVLGYGQAMTLREERQADFRARMGKEKSIPIWADIETRWRATTHTLPHRDDLLNSVVLSEAAPLYSMMPDFKKKHLEAQEAAAAAAAAAAAQAMIMPNSPGPPTTRRGGFLPRNTSLAGRRQSHAGLHPPSPSRLGPLPAPSGASGSSGSGTARGEVPSTARGTGAQHSTEHDVPVDLKADDSLGSFVQLQSPPISRR